MLTYIYNPAEEWPDTIDLSDLSTNPVQYRVCAVTQPLNQTCMSEE